MSLVFLASKTLLAIPPRRLEEKSIIEVAWWLFSWIKESGLAT